MIVYLNAIDPAHGITLEVARQLCYIRHRGLSDKLILAIDPSLTVDRICQLIISNVRNEFSIWELIINAHGSGGSICLGQHITESELPKLRPLRNYFNPRGPGAIIDACNVAEGNVGLRFIKAFATTINRPVTGAASEQIPYPLPTYDQGQWEGSVIRAYPDGRTVQFNGPNPIANTIAQLRADG